MSKPVVLIVNDDGVNAPGIRALKTALDPHADVWTVAPEDERSAQAMALTVKVPLRYSSLGDQRYSVTGTPVDCIFMAFDQILPQRPDWVISGINRGGNLGSDTLYSGTVAAAHEAALRGVKSIAVSCEPIGGGQNTLHDDIPGGYSDGLYYDTAGMVAATIFENRDDLNMVPGRVLNINVPSVPPSALRGIVPAKLGRRTYHHKLIQYKDPRGHMSFWIGAVPDFIPEDGTDCVAVHEGYATLTMLKPCYYDDQATATINQAFFNQRVMDRANKI